MRTQVICIPQSTSATDATERINMMLTKFVNPKVEIACSHTGCDYVIVSEREPNDGK